MIERWLPISGFPGYEVSNTGKVRSFKGGGGGRPPRKNPRLLLSTINSKGYRVNGLVRNGRRHTVNLHTVVAHHFCGKKRIGFECSHINGNRSDCRASNLIWESHVTNMTRMRGHGPHPSGLQNGRAILTLDQVRSVKPRRNSGESLSSIARSFGVNVTSVWGIYHNKHWVGLSD